MFRPPMPSSHDLSGLFACCRPDSGRRRGQSVADRRRRLHFVTSDGDRWVYAGPELPPDLDDAGLSFGSSTFGSSTFGS